MIRIRNSIGYFVTLFFLSYYLLMFQISFSQDASNTDAQPPVVKAPPFVNAAAKGPSWTQVNFQVNATSSSAAKISVYCNPGSGSAFPMGSTIVLCAAKDPHTNLVSYAMFNVTVKDTTPPTFKLPNSILKQATDPEGTKVSYKTNASDTVDGNTMTACNPPSGSLFPLGSNHVICVATDKSGNKATRSFSVIIGQRTTSISASAQNVTNQLQPSEFTVSKNTTNESSSLMDNVKNNKTGNEVTAVSKNTTNESSSLMDNVKNNKTGMDQIQGVNTDKPTDNNGLLKLIIDSGNNQRVAAGSLVKIKGTSIHDSGNEKLSFEWKQTEGKRIDPEDARISAQAIASEIAPQIAGNTTNLTFEVKAPQVKTDNDKLTFEIIAKDSNGNSANDFVDIFIDKNAKLVSTDDLENRQNILESATDQEQNKNN
ncbi:MAG: HYR domain-containing protein [Thaumarchaeota archaeon]|nr:MAG: HYR domain-containing protein [Nitrososphaerota archaeon]